MTERLTAKAYLVSQQKPTAQPAAGKASTKPKKPSPTNSLTKAVIELLQLLGCVAWRQNNGGVWDPTRQVFRAGSSTPGISDILGYHRPTGRFVAVEIKTNSDTLTDAQTAFLDQVRHAGGFAVEARSVEQVRQEFNHWRQTLTP